MVSALSKALTTYKKAAPVIAEIQYLQSEKMHNKMEEINKTVQDRVGWNNISAYTQLVGGGITGALKLATTALSPEAGKVTEAVSSVLPHVTQAATTLEQGQTITPEFKQAIFTQGYAQEKQKTQSMKDLGSEMKQQVQNLQQREEAATRRAAQAAGS